jgi:Zn-dependent M16 (insulinase) family peptidase
VKTNKKGAKMIHGFEFVKEQFINELNTHARLFRHVKTGARLLSMENQDENKVFGINFRTPPTDSTGVPHIMEHAVLCGSRRYPVKEPFVELLKGSLKTFLNAFTFPDKTGYPIASQNLKDFYNLVEVYLDAVFYPLITPYTLQQEGWHYELDSLDGPLTFKGVVFNEMKGAYSDPDSLLGKLVQESLFPDNVYGLDSGGDPVHIPDLTYEAFTNFHRTYYHPSNSYIYFYGDDNPEERLRYMDTWLRDFEPLQVESSIALQPRFPQPKKLEFPYEVSAEEGEEGLKKAMLTVNWMLDETRDPQLSLALGILGHILVGTPASPLRKALIDSGLGEDLAGGGMSEDTRQVTFSTGLKGIALEDADKVESLVLETLKGLAAEGIDPDMTAASVNTIEFNLRENNFGSFPRGLMLMLVAMSNWLHEGDPIQSLAFDAPLSAIKAQLTPENRYFEHLIQEYFIHNPHRVTVLLKPDAELGRQKEEEENSRLSRVRQGLSPADLQAILDNTAELKHRQVAPDSPAALATIPGLQLADLDKEIRTIPVEAGEVAGSQVLFHDLFTNGILYLDLAFDLHTLPQVYLHYMNLFGRALLEMGTEKEDYVKLSQHIGRSTGGINASTFASMVRGGAKSAALFVLRGKATLDKTAELLVILQDVLLTARLDNQERFRQLVLEEKSSQEAGLIPMGHSVTNLRLRALFNEADWANEQIDGPSYLFFLRKLAERVETDWQGVLADLEAMRQALVNRSSLVCNVTVDALGWQRFQPDLGAFLDKLPAAKVVRQAWQPAGGSPFEGLSIPAQVNYVGKGADLFQLGYTLHGSVQVIMNFLRTTWLWERVRVQGGAYGGMARFDIRSGVFTFLSYRDPNLLKTIENYDGTAKYLQEVNQERLSQPELVKSIIGAIGELDAYLLPDAKGFTSLVRFLVGETDRLRQQYRDQLLRTTLADFQAFGTVLEKVNQAGKVVVVGSAEALQAANQEHNGFLTVQKLL